MSAWTSHVRRPKANALDVLPDVNGLEWLTSEGHVRMADGRYVALVRIGGRNTALPDAQERDEVAAALSAAIDEECRGMPFRLFSTTRPAGVDGVAERYEARAWDGTTTEAQTDLLLDIADWLREEDAPNWEAREWRHYMAVEADAAAVQQADPPGVLSMLNPLSDTGGATAPDSAIRETLGKRVQTAIGAIQSVPGLTAIQATPYDTLDVVRQRWGRSGDLPLGFVTDLESGAVDIQRVTAPTTYSPQKGWVDLGDEYARTLWVSEYARDLESLWLKPLTTLRGVDIDVTVNAMPETVENASFTLGQTYADTGSEQAEREREGDASARDAEVATNAAVKMRTLINETATQPWNVSTYITVRARDEDALEQAADTLATFENLDAARMAALNDAAQEIHDLLAQSPTNAEAIAPGVFQDMVFRSASPFTRDEWEAETSAPNTRLVPGAAIGSMFPPAAADLREPNGIDWGRNEENGTHLRLSPFERGGAPHMLTIGQSRSGKTYAATKAALRWYLERDDRTLIVVDTQRGFEGLVEACEGEHIEVDTGSQAVNPLRIEPPGEDDRAAEEFRMTVEETVGFLLNLLRADGVEDAGEYAPLLSQAAERTLTDAGIDPATPETFGGDGPHLGDLLETVIDMNEAPEDYTWSGRGVEGEIHERQVGELLTRLRSFQPGGKYAPLVGRDEIGIIDDSVDMAYLDLHALSGAEDTEKSAMLQLVLAQVREKIKQAPGETILMLDEAHVLLDTERTANWLQKAAREFARYEACLFYLSQAPQDFVSGEGETAARDTIRQQCSMVHFFRTPGADPAVLEQFGLNKTQRGFVRDEAVRGRAGKGYSECLINATDVEGWLPCYIEASPAEHAVITGENV